MSHYVYIIYSKTRNRFYTGESAFPEGRLDEHNSSHYNDSFTSRANDWKTYLTIECINRNQALKIEKKIKSMKSRTYIENLKKYPEMVEKLQKL